MCEIWQKRGLVHKVSSNTEKCNYWDSLPLHVADYLGISKTHTSIWTTSKPVTKHVQELEPIDVETKVCDSEKETARRHEGDAQKSQWISEIMVHWDETVEKSYSEL